MATRSNQRSRSSSSGRTHGRSTGGGGSSSKTRPESGRGGRSSAAARGRSSSRASSSRASASSRSKSAGSKSSGRSGSKMTSNHEFIRRWAEKRGGKPTCVLGTGGRGDTGMLRIDFPGYSGRGKLQPISWDEWFEKFDEKNLALLY